MPDHSVLAVVPTFGPAPAALTFTLMLAAAAEIAAATVAPNGPATAKMPCPAVGPKLAADWSMLAPAVCSCAAPV